VKKKIQRVGSKCRETACYLDEQRTGGERRVVAACWCTLLDWWLLSCFSGRRKGIAGWSLGIWRKGRRTAGALLGFQLLLLVLARIAEDRKAASC
jgi:hypothetical protein